MNALPGGVDGEDLEQLVWQTRDRLRKHTVLTGGAVMLAGVVGFLTVASAVDLVLPLSVGLRVGAAVLFWVIVAAAVAGAVAWPALRPLRVDGVAYRMERTVPNMHNRLITLLDVRRGRLSTEAGDEFVARLIEQTRGRLSDYAVADVARPRPVKAALSAAGVSVAVLLVMLIAFNDRMPTAMARVLRPTAAIAPVSWIKLHSVTGDRQVLQGEPVTIEAVVDRGSVDGLTCSLQGASGRWHDYPMAAAGEGRFVHTIEAVSEDYAYLLRGGGTWTATYAVKMLVRPVVERVGAEIRLPAYMEITEAQPVFDGATQISAPVGSSLLISAAVAGDATGGVIELLDASSSEGTDSVDNEVVWFDDDLPADAVTTGKLRWVNDRPFSGSRGFTFDWQREPFGFSTKLSKLAVERDATVFVYVRAASGARPATLTVTLAAGEAQYVLKWRSEGVSASDGDAGAAFTGIWRAGAGWVRLAAPVSGFAGGEGEALLLTGATFSVDGGDVMLDRMGVFRKGTAVVRKSTLTTTRTIEMSRVEDSRSGEGRPGDEERGGERASHWEGRVDVDQDCFYRLTFKNSEGHASASMEPVVVLATTDQPPTVLIEKPGKDLLLDEPTVVPVMARAFDDYGVKLVAVEFGSSAEQFDEEVPIAEGTFDEPRLSRALLTAVDAKERGLEAGQGLYWRLVARDFKGQSGFSRAFRLAIATPDQGGDAVARRPGALGGLLEQIAGLFEVQGAITEGLDEMIGSLLPADRALEIKGTVKLLNPDGTPMSAEQIQQLFAEMDAQMAGEQGQRMAALQEQLVRQQQMFAQLQGELRGAADQAGASMLSMPQEELVLRQMAEQAEWMGGDRPWDQLGENPGWLASLEEQMPQMGQMLEELEQQVQQLEQAREGMGRDFLAAHEEMMAMMAEMRGQGALNVMEDMAMSVNQQLRDIAALQSQLKEMSEQTQIGTAEELEKLSGEQAAFDERTADEIAESMELMRQMYDDWQSGTEMFAPWVPPRRGGNQTPVEQDTPEEDPQEQKDEDGDEKEATGAEDELNWWDQRADFSQQYQWLSSQEDRYQGRQRNVDRPRDDERDGDRGQEYSPRELMSMHQQAMGDQLTQNSDELGSAGQQMSQMQQQLQSMMQSMRQAGDAGQMQQRMSAAMQMQQMLNSPQMMRMTSMAERARAMQMMQRMGGSMGQAYLSRFGGLSGSAYAIEMPVGGPVDLKMSAAQRAAVYRLPPSRREPLLQSMQERGPEAYQELIDAYYQQLTQSDEP
ncbi:MAG: hypothetical protein CMJ49_00990 [Planctomycetaceae bacterium]|nr:hypothetical protein [Planctomycetaceae bacterium]